MQKDEIREGFDEVIAKISDPDAIARMEIAREFFTNPDFRKALEDHTWQANEKNSNG
jgi:hypothetical protein